MTAPAGGPARLVLTVKRLDQDRTDDRAWWGDPRVEAPRPLSDLLQWLMSSLSQRTLRGLWHRALPADSERLYTLWTREHQPSPRLLRVQQESSGDSARRFSLITYVSASPPWPSDATAAGVFGQSYPHWEWLVVTPERAIGDVTGRLRRDSRVRVIGVPSASSRAEAWNAGLEHSQSSHAALLDPDDVLSPHALYEMSKVLEDAPELDAVYSDEDHIDSAGRRRDPHFKPDWSPELLLSGNYLGRLTMFRVAMLRTAGGFCTDCEGVEEWDLVLRLARAGARARRLPKCLYHGRRTAPSVAPERIERLLQAHCEQLGLTNVAARVTGSPRVTWDVPGAPTVSVIIPNRNAGAVLEQCLRGFREVTRYPHLELVIVDNGSTDPDVHALYRALEREGRARIVPFDRPFNFSAACNVGAAAASGELLLFLNNDIEMIEPDWLDELVRWAQRPDIGIVGAKLLYPDGLIQHAGVVFGVGLVGHIFARAPEGTTGLFGSTESYRNYLAVTGACQMMRRDVFRRLGGYDERFRLSFSDVVLCMEAWKAGYRVVYTPYARLIHHESHTRQREDSVEDMELLARYLRTTGFLQDPYFHPELDPKSPTPAVRPPFDASAPQVINDYVERVLASTPIGAR